MILNGSSLRKCAAFLLSITHGITNRSQELMDQNELSDVYASMIEEDASACVVNFDESDPTDAPSRVNLSQEVVPTDTPSRVNLSQEVVPTAEDFERARQGGTQFASRSDAAVGPMLAWYTAPSQVLHVQKRKEWLCVKCTRTFDCSERECDFWIRFVPRQSLFLLSCVFCVGNRCNQCDETCCCLCADLEEDFDKENGDWLCWDCLHVCFAP